MNIFVFFIFNFVNFIQKKKTLKGTKLKHFSACFEFIMPSWVAMVPSTAHRYTRPYIPYIILYSRFSSSQSMFVFESSRFMNRIHEHECMNRVSTTQINKQAQQSLNTIMRMNATSPFISICFLLILSICVFVFVCVCVQKNSIRLRLFFSLLHHEWMKDY